MNDPSFRFGQIGDGVVAFYIYAMRNYATISSAIIRRFFAVDSEMQSVNLLVPSRDECVWVLTPKQSWAIVTNATFPCLRKFFEASSGINHAQ